MNKEFVELREFLPDLVKELEKRAPYASVLATTSQGINIEVENREQRISQLAPSQGVVLTAFNGEYFEEFATGDLSFDNLFRLSKEFANSISIKKELLKIDPGKELKAHFSTECKVDPTSVPLKEKFEYVKQLHNKLEALDKRIINAQVTYSDEAETKIFANRNRLISQELRRVIVFLILYVSDKERTEFDWDYESGTGGFEIAQIPDERLNNLKDTALRLLSAERISPGMYDVVVDPDISGVLAHESFGHGVELDMFLKGRARAKDYLNRQVASPIVNILDDPSLPGAYGSYFFDDEGQQAEPTYIIRNGIFERGLSDLYSASALKTARTANGRRESFQKKVYARMSNTFFARGNTDKEEMIKEIKKGIYLCRSESGMEDPKDWGIQVIAHFGYEIRDGRFTGRIYSPVGITGYVPDMLMSISAVGSDFELKGSTCGKGWKENIPVSTGGPHLRLRARLG